MKKYEPSNAGGFEVFERELHALFAQTECAVTEEALARHDVDLPVVFIDGEMHRRACCCAQTYLSAAGPVSVTRTLYRARRGERAVAALERKVGIVEGYWTPLAARQGAMLVSHLIPRDAEEVLATLGHKQPSKSSLDRLPKALSARWEAQRETFETTVREATVEVPDAAEVDPLWWTPEHCAEEVGRPEILDKHCRHDPVARLVADGGGVLGRAVEQIHSHHPHPE